MRLAASLRRAWGSALAGGSRLNIPTSISPGAGHRARLPVRQKLYCEALPGVADPVTTWSGELGRLYPGGRVVPVSRKARHTAELNCSNVRMVVAAVRQRGGRIASGGDLGKSNFWGRTLV